METIIVNENTETIKVSTPNGDTFAVNMPNSYKIGVNSNAPDLSGVAKQSTLLEVKALLEDYATDAEIDAMWSEQSYNPTFTDGVLADGNFDEETGVLNSDGFELDENGVLTIKS